MKLPPGHVPGKGVHKATAMGGFGERLLTKMGWAKGQGLGSTGNGMVKPIEVKVKEDTAGVGVSKSQQWEHKWWEDAYNSAASGIVHGAGSASDSDSDSGSGVSASEQFPAAKRVRLHRDGTVASATPAELEILAQLSKDSWGRFGGREGKMERIRRQEEAALRAKQCASVQSSAAQVVVAQAAAQIVTAQPGKGSAVGFSASSSQAAVPEADQQAAKRKRNSAQVPGLADPAAAVGAAVLGSADSGAMVSSVDEQSPASTQAPGRGDGLAGSGSTAGGGALTVGSWWGAKRFCSAGNLEGLEQDLKPSPAARQAFTEATQENLYMALHGSKTAGKKGLGKAEAKVGGVRWAGSKTVFADDDCQGSPSCGVPSAHSQKPSSHVDTAGGLDTDAASFKWKKLITEVLAKTDKRQMKLSKLQKVVASEALQRFFNGQPQNAKALKTLIAAKVGSSSKFSVSQKVVKLL